ncbi:hypothetical protein MKZ38_006662 [Zalerion maritima]|uniref:Uncharacterized protein n=1 Tax=Zalerion maritima TaxID=339359 RepID=A0AAD5RX12_9PEZI|nr:hypothetical protein MKZ38_006662 [Zalerion maritima]
MSTLTREQIKSYFPNGEVPDEVMKLADEVLDREEMPTSPENSSLAVNTAGGNEIRPRRYQNATQAQAEYTTGQAILDNMIADRKAISRRINFVLETLGPLPKRYHGQTVEKLEDMKKNHAELIAAMGKNTKEQFNKCEQLIHDHIKHAELLESKMDAFHTELGYLKIILLVAIAIIIMMAHKIFILW